MSFVHSFYLVLSGILFGLFTDFYKIVVRDFSVSAPVYLSLLSLSLLLSISLFTVVSTPLSLYQVISPFISCLSIYLYFSLLLPLISLSPLFPSYCLLRSLRRTNS